MYGTMKNHGRVASHRQILEKPFYRIFSTSFIQKTYNSFCCPTLCTVERLNVDDTCRKYLNLFVLTKSTERLFFRRG